MTAPVESVASVVELVGGFERGELDLAFQPIVPLQQGRRRRRTVYEALLRWHHVARGALLPDDFLGAATNVGVRGALSAYVIRHAAEACSSWVAAGHDVGVAVNVWPSDIVNHRVRAAIDVVLSAGLAPDRLTIEVTERACPLDDRTFSAGLVSLARLGIRLSLDDFGTGDSSLARLRHVHFDEVKIDRVFVSGAAGDPTDRSIVGFSVQLAHALGMEAVAEGIESETTAAIAEELGADCGQGWLFGRPDAFPTSR